jgi:uncharacterized protein (TIGR00369 family)
MKSSQCFICGDESAKGFHIHFHPDDNGVYARYTCQRYHEGWPGIQHGGVTSAILDEASGYIPHFMNVPTVTAALNITFHAPILVGEHLEVRSKASKVTRHLIQVEASIRNDAGELKASSTAKMMVLTDKHMETMGIARQA